MKRSLFALLASLLLASPALCQIPGGSEIQLTRTPVTGGAVAGDCLTISSTLKVTQAVCGGIPSGAAGGDLGGTYPNPTVVSVADVTTGVLPGANGGTGVANTGKTITLGGNLTTSGAFASTFTMTNTTTVTFPVSGTLLSTGNATGTGTVAVLQTSPALITPTATTLAIGGATIGTAVFAVAGTSMLTGDLLFTDGTYDIGKNGATRPRNGFFSGGISAQGSSAFGDVSINGANAYTWTTRSAILSPADGNLRLSNNAGTSFGLLQFGGVSSSFPAWKRSGTTVAARLADDSADAPITGSNLTLSGVLQLGNAYVAGVVVSTGTVTLKDSSGTTVRVLVANP